MPHNFDFSKIEHIKTVEINPIGWINPLQIEYGVYEDFHVHGGLPSYYWRIKGTNHTFVIPISRLDFISSGDYKKHFEDVLENFREDYISWKEEDFQTEWQKEYKGQFSRFILL